MKIFNLLKTYLKLEVRVKIIGLIIIVGVIVLGILGYRKKKTKENVFKEHRYIKK